MQGSAKPHMKHFSFLPAIFSLWAAVIQPVTATTVPLFVSVDATTLFARLGITEQVNFMGNLANTYVPEKKWDNKTTVMFGVGATTYEKNKLLLNTGARYFSTTSFLFNGNVWQLSNPNFNNLSYRYRVKSDVILIENAISYTQHLIQPSFIVGLGYANNTASHYQVTPLYTHETPALQTFSSKSTSQFAYEVGVGLDYLLLKPAVLELAYRFVGAGKGYLGYSSIQNTTGRLSTGNINYQTISLGIRLYYDHTY